MKRFEIGICIVLAALLALMAYPAVVKVRKANAETARIEASMKPDHPHKWERWSDPKTLSDWWNGSRFEQTRRCETCGEAQTRRVQISPGS